MIRIVEDLTKRPHSSIPEACMSSAGTKAAYRFLKSEKVKVEDIQQTVVNATIERIKEECQKKEEDVILIPHDTSELNFSSLHQTEGLGPISNANCSGIIVHTAMALTSEGKPLGILYQEFWERNHNERKKNKKTVPTEEKESYKWIKTIKRLDEIIPEDVKTVSISDRESDIYDYFATTRKGNHHVLFRISHDRSLASKSIEDKSQGARLFDSLRQVEDYQGIVIKLSRRKSVETRELQVQVSYQIVEILPPVHLKSKYKDKSSIRMTAIYARNNKAELEWFLLSSIIASNLDEAVQLVRYYEKRWLIERYHFILKSGCQVEELQLSESRRLEKAIALYSIVAWRIMYMTYISRLEPLRSSSELLSENEWKALYIFSYRKQPKRPPLIYEAVVLIAKLGGFQGRRSDGFPGAKVIWRGMKRLSDISKAYEIYKLMGNA